MCDYYSAEINKVASVLKIIVIENGVELVMFD